MRKKPNKREGIDEEGDALQGINRMFGQYDFRDD